MCFTCNLPVFSVYFAQKLVATQTPWTRSLLDKNRVSLYHFLASQPWQLNGVDLSKTSEAMVAQLMDSVSKNKINLQNYRNVNKVATMLFNHGVLSTSDAPCPTLYFSDLAATEKDLFDYLSRTVPNGVKSIYYNIPKVTLGDIKSELSLMDPSDIAFQRQAWTMLQFKNTSTAIKALLAMATSDNVAFHNLASFGPPKECDSSGVIGSSSRSIIEGFLQVDAPKEVLAKHREFVAKQKRRHEMKENESSPSPSLESMDEIGDAFYDPNNAANKPKSPKSDNNKGVQNGDCPYFWCKIADSTFTAYAKLHDNDTPLFTLSIDEIQVHAQGPGAFDLVSYQETYRIRSSNEALCTLWRVILERFQAGKLNHLKLEMENAQKAFKRKIDVRKENGDGVWYCHKCYLSKKTLPIFLLYSPDGHKWFADRKMLNQYVRSCLQRGQLDQISTRFTVSDLKDILSNELFEDFAAKQLETLIEQKSHFLKCPACKMPMEVLSSNKKICPEVEMAMKKVFDIIFLSVFCKLERSGHVE